MVAEYVWIVSIWILLARILIDRTAVTVGYYVLAASRLQATAAFLYRVSMLSPCLHECPSVYSHSPKTCRFDHLVTLKCPWVCVWMAVWLSKWKVNSELYYQMNLESNWKWNTDYKFICGSFRVTLLSLYFLGLLLFHTSVNSLGLL